ncbi:MAG: hypothetical protein HOY71_14705, partial [Nonomuraea sp.]|nr:hypothetical protein [Nonomuraea sp.]
VLAGGLAVLLRAFVVAAGGPFGAGDFLEAYAGAGLQMGFAAGPFVILGVLTEVPRRVLLYGAAALAVVALAPAVRPSPGAGPVTVGAGVWHEERADPRQTIDVARPVTHGPGADRIDAALLAPVRALVAATPDATRVTASYVVTRHDDDVLSVRYLTRWEGPHPGERAQTAIYDLRAGRPLGVRDVFTPAALSRAGRERLAATLRPLLLPGAVANPSLLRVDGDFAEVGLAPGAVELTYGRGLLCPDCPAVTVRVPEKRLAGLLRPWR